jgi:phosphoheptose isomerase
MHELIEKRLRAHSEITEEVLETLQNYIYMAALLSYEAALRGNRLFIYGEGRSYIIAVYLAQRLKESHAKLDAVAMRERQEDRALFLDHLREGDIFIAISLFEESDYLPELLEAVRQKEAKSIGLCAKKSSALMRRCDVAITIAAYNPYLVDEMHMLVCNIIADAIDDVLKEGG